MSGFDLLHPAVQHHVVNSLGWRSLRPLQDAAVAPILAGRHGLLMAPTAGGKTEAAVLPLMSRMAAERWEGLGALYVTPTKALANDLVQRLERYLGLIGRRVGVWHGDVGGSLRRRMLGEPPDLLLTTPESIEAMLISTRVAHDDLLGSLRAVVVDEAHAFAGDDRGWHLVAVLERLARVAGRDLQRIGLSATLGNPEDILDWLVGSSRGPREVVAPPAPAGAPPEVQLDHVGSIQNAATLIARLHTGEKRLVFADSRASAEELAGQLRGRAVRTFVSHSSLSREERLRAERAFAEEADCVIVATSTLELGVDVGDLDRVIQIDAPRTVASFLQRLGRSGRRAGTVRNCLFLATTDDALLRAAALLVLWHRGFVEPVVPPPCPLHIVAQQVLALVLQEGRVERGRPDTWLGATPALLGAGPGELRRIIDHLVESGILFDEGGLLSMGAGGEQEFGRRHFADLTSAFTSDPLVRVLHGRVELGAVHSASFRARGDEPTVLMLAGRSWRVRHVDWNRLAAQVEPAAGGGRSRWRGDPQPLHGTLCRAMRSVLARAATPEGLTRRGVERLERLRQDAWWAREGRTTIVSDGDGQVWWTFAGARANRVLAARLGTLGDPSRSPDNLGVPLAPQSGLGAIAARVGPGVEAKVDVVREAEELKFAAALPRSLALAVARARALDPAGADATASEPVGTARA